MVKKNHRYVGIPNQLYDQAENIVEDKSKGYYTVAEFVRDAVRRRVEALEPLEALQA